MTFKSSIFSVKLIAVTLVFCSLYSCENPIIGDIDDLATSSFNIDSFEQGIVDAWSTNTTGFAYAIAQNGVVVRYNGFGAARTSLDAPYTAYTAETRQGVASSTKLVTAIAIAKALEINGKTLDEKIGNYLPTNWVVLEEYRDLTFRQLLAHQTGFTSQGSLYANLQSMMLTPQIQPVPDVYSNANYALCRVLLGYIYFGPEFFEESETNNINDVITADAFLSVCREIVFWPSGLEFWDIVAFQEWTHTTDATGFYPFSRSYNFADTTTLAGIPDDNSHLTAGAGGLHISAYELAQIVIAFENNQLVSKEMVNEMKKSACGFDGQIDGAHGAYYHKNGGFSDNLGRGVGSIIMTFPNGIQLTMTTNCNGESPQLNSPQVVADIYDAAW
jgi:hypothetical protein